MKYSLNQNWTFVRGRVSRAWLQGRAETAGETVGLPHCWNERDSFQEGIAYYRGPGAYRRSFTAPPAAAGETWRLVAEGFYGTGDVWLNGSRLARVDGQYLGFELDLGDRLRPGEANDIAIRLTNRCASHVLPGIKMPDFLLYGGLSGRMFLERRSDVRVEASDVSVVADDALTDAPRLNISFVVRNASASARQARIHWSLRADADEPPLVVGETDELALPAAAASIEQTVVLPVDRPRRWHVDDPFRYILRCEVREGAAVRDCWERRIGIRQAEFRGDGFYLNGERLFLQGWNRHEDMPGLGRALSPALHRQDAALLKRAGGNLVRLSHYPQHPAFLDACDELGILVYAEIATWKSVREGRWLRSALRQMEEMVRRDRNRPSVILWGMGNESRSRKAYMALGDLVRSLDPTRPTVYAENHLYRGRRHNTLALPDVLGVNYELTELDEAVTVSRHGAVLVSECGNNPLARRGDRAEELRQVQMLQDDWRLLRDHPRNAGYALWCMNDYATLRKRRYFRYSGLLDAWRMPKMAYALLCARASASPFLKLYADWRRDGAGPREAHVFSNCPAVHLASGDWEETIEPIDGHASATVEFTGESLRAAGVHDGVAVAEVVEAYGEATAIRIEADADVIDNEVAQFECWIDDADGRPVLDWEGEMAVHALGAARVLYFGARKIVPVSTGRARIYLRRAGAGDEGDVQATVPGLTAATCHVAWPAPSGPSEL